ncbi:MAG: glycosyltransferase [Candidatus Kapabacteria bacterium]|nr:glycosyltransferase [Candidatus Kapabacteria bacterium]
MEQVIYGIFLVSIGVFLYTYIGYPCLLWILSLLFSKKQTTHVTNIEGISVAVVIAAYNEENSIADCLDAILASELNGVTLQIFVGSDGSTDETNAIVQEYERYFPSVTLLPFPRGGKNKTLNKTFEQINHSLYPFVVLVDADIRVQKNTIQQLLDKFTDNRVGAVLARRTHSEINDSNSTVIMSEGVYHSLEVFIQKIESKIWSTVNTFGPCYALRTRLFTPIPSLAVCDDFFITSSVNLQHKCVVLAENAQVVEVRDRSVQRDFKRRIRTVSGGLATIASIPTILNPFSKWIGFFMWSHKMLRWFTPLYLITILLTSFLLETSFFSLYFIAFELSILFLSLLLFYLEDKVEIPSKIKIFGYFFSLNIAMIVGITEFLQGKATSIWSNEQQ